MVSRRSTIVLNLAYLVVAGSLLAGAWYGGHAWFADWKSQVENDWVALDQQRWGTVNVPGMSVRSSLLIGEEKNEDRRAQLLLLCSDKADLHLLSKTIINLDEEYKPLRKAWIVEATLRASASDNQEIHLPNMAWSFVDGLDLVLSPPLTSEQADTLTAIVSDSLSGDITMSHSETAIFVKPTAEHDTLKAFIDNCKISERA